MILAILPILAALALPFQAMAGTPLAGKVIALDAGHGGEDVGAVNENPAHSLFEKDMDISVARLLKEKLEKDGARVAMIRAGDETVSLNDRVARADASGADVLLSIHHNSADPSVNGTEAYFTQEDDRPLAEAMNRHLGADLGIQNRGAKHMADFALTRRPKMPSTITEASFVTNDAEARAFRFGPRAEEEATCLYKGLIEYFSVA